MAYLVVLIGYSVSSASSYDDFFQAIRADHVRGVVKLLERGFDPNSRDEKGRPGLQFALEEGCFAVADVLLRQPTLQVDAPNGANETALMRVALAGDLVWTRKLLDRGAAPHRTGWSPLLYAASGPEPQVLALLLDRGADIDARSPNGSTALMMASRYASDDAVKLLLKRGANPALRNDLGLTAADFAREGGREKLAAQLQALLR